MVFFSRQGGVSSGLYSSLNCGLGSDDNTSNVMENRKRIALNLGVEETHLAGCYQIHSPTVVKIEGPVTDERPKADGMATNQIGVALGILTADCGPILFADPSRKIIGACHAGWKGALSGVAENTITAMEELGAERSAIIAVLGPCISQKNYEVGAEFKQQFCEQNQSFEKFFGIGKDANHFQFDMQNFILEKLQNAGVQAAMTGHCTYADENQFFSYRRTTHRGEPDYGRQISAIALT